MAPSKAKKPFTGKQHAPPDGPPAVEQAPSPPAVQKDAAIAPQNSQKEDWVAEVLEELNDSAKAGARVDAQAGPSLEVPRSDKTLKHDIQQADAAKVIGSVVAKEKLDMVDPIASLAQDINEEVSDFPMEILSVLSNKIKDYFQHYSGKKLLTTTMGISIASSLFNILKDIYVACKANTPGAKTLCVLGILTSLCGLASSIATICHLHHCDFDLQAAMVHIKDVVKPHLEGPEPCVEVTALDKFKAWIPKIMSFLATSVAAGLSFLPPGSAVGTLIKNYGNSKKIGEDVSSMMTSFLTDVVGITLEGDPAYVDSLVKLNAEGVELLTTPMHRFHIDTKKRSKLVTYPIRVDEATLHRTNNDTFKTLRMTLQSLQATRNQVVQRVQELFDCSQRTLRQEPVGIYLSGMGGIGKSYFAKELAQELHKECGYPEDIYCIDKCDQNFYEPYKGEATGIANEFMGRRAENEPLLRDVNKICSEDYFNFEGAALHTKNQPCHLKAVLVTSNVKNPDLTKVQEPSVTAAMWSRFRRFEVMDSRFSTAEEARSNPRNLERGSEFLTFKEYVTDLNRNLTEIKEWTAQEVKDYVVKECRKRERAYLNKVLRSDPYKLDEQGKKELQERIAILEGLAPCARDGRVFIVRLEGPPGTGKTYFMEKCLIPTICNTFPALTLHRWSSASPLLSDGKPYLVIVDDSLDDSEKEYFDMVRTISNRSIIIIGTNTSTHPTLTWTSATIGRLPVLGSAFRWAPAVDVTPIPGVPTGFWRRVGIADRIRIGTLEFEPYVGDCAHFRFYNGYIIKKDGKQLALEAVEEEILDKYIAFLQDAGDFVWSERRLNIDDPTVKIVARSYKDMVEVLSGSSGMASLVKCFTRSGTRKPDPRMQIFLDPAFMKQVSSQVGTEEWRVPDRPLTGKTRLQIAEKISAFLRRLKPNATVVVQITNPGLDDGGRSTEPHLYELKGSMGFYTQSSLCTPRAQVTYDQHGVRIHVTNEVVSYTECAMIDADHELPSCYKPATIRIIKQNTLQHPRVQHAKMLYTRGCNLRKAMLTEKVIMFFKHPAVIACLSIVGALALAGIIYGIYRACVSACASPEDEEELVPCDDTADSRDGTQRKAAAQALRKGSPPKNTKQQKIKFEADTRTQQDIDDWTNNYWFSLPGVTPYHDEFENLSPGAKQVLKELADKSGVVPATVMPDMELKPHVDPRLSGLMDKLCHNLVTVCGHGNNYGLVFEGDILVTTGHTVAGLTDVRVRSKEFTGTARVLKVSISRDLAVLQLIKTDAGRRPPQFPSLRKHFLASLTQIDKMAWFVKPFTRNTVYVCGKMVTTPSYKCFSSHLSETFNPSEWIVTFFQYRMPWNPTLFQPGECGLPLFVEINGEYKICGIFNGACQNQNVIFASVTASDFNNTQGIVPSSFTTCAQIEYQSEAAGVPTFTANSFVVECFDAICYGYVTHVEAGYPQPIGHCSKLRAHSYPKHKALPLVPNNMSAPGGLENTQRLSCISESLSPDNVYIPRRTKFEDGKRVPHNKEPLFLQIQKYNKAPGFKADKKLFAKAIAEVIHSYKLRIKKTAPLALLSVKQCINGVRGGALAGFQRDTGAGPTLRAKFNITVKKDVLYQVREDPPIHILADNAAGRWVQNEVSEKLTSILNGVPVVLLTRACKKVEKIDKESWEKAKVRLFTECDFADNILLKILFGEMQSELASADGTPLLLNMNPYTMPDIVAELMGHNLDNLVGTDISSMDKHFPRELIVAFVQVAGALYEWPQAVQRAIAATLMFPLQNFEGDVFTSPCGNLSGWFVTSLINCVAQELMIAYDRLKNLQGNDAPFNLLRIPAEPYAILGDDKIQRLTPGRAVAQEQSYLECGFVMQAGSKLQEKEERFCSRCLYKEDGKYYGALKLSAISGLVYFASSSELEAITPNFSLALFEAALHQNPGVYDKTLIAIKFVADRNGMQLAELASRERYRELYDQYCSGLASVLSFCGHRPDILSILEHCKMGDNARMALNQYAQQTKQAPPTQQFIKMEGPAHSPTWTVDLAFAGKTYVGTGESKSAATEVAAKAALEQLRVTPTMDPVKDDVVINNETTAVIATVPNGYRIDVSRIENGIPREEMVLYRKNMNSAKRAAKHPGEQRILDLLAVAHLQFVGKIGGKVCVWVDSKVVPPLKDHVHNGVRYKTDEEGTSYVLSTVMQQLTYSIVVGALTQAGSTPVPEEHRIYYESADGPCMANDTPIQPENVQQATMNTGALTIPQMSNPQPSGQAPSLAPPAEKIVSALEGVQSETLNPLGPPNMLAVGAVCFDLKDLVYSQFMDCDQQFIVTDDTPAGSVLLQIPYDPLGEWVNPYIRQYISQHERYTGTLGFRITIVGNPTFSGLIGVAWQPRRVTTPTVNVSEMQKYSYYGVTVELPSNKVIWLNDARQSLFWRSTLDVSDVDSRPHLVVFNLLSLVSPLREGIQTRLRIASKLSNGGVDDGIGRNAFQVSLPTIFSSSASSTRTAVSAQATRLADLVPEFSGKEIFMCTDGTSYSGNAMAERGETLDTETRTYGGLHDQNKLFNQIPRPTNNTQDFGTAGVGQDYTPDPLRQGFNTFSLVLPPSPPVTVSESEGPQTIVAWYETNNLPVPHYERIVARVFANVQGPATPSEVFDTFINRVSSTSTMADLDLLAIYTGPAVTAGDNDEFAPPATMIQNINWPLTTSTSQTRYGYALTTAHTTSYRGIKLVFRQGMMFIFQVQTTAQVSVGATADRGPTAISQGPIVPRGTHACASNHLWQLAVPMPLNKNFPPWLVETQAAVASAAQLPAGWARLSIGSVVPSVVLPTIFGTTMLSNSGFERALARRSAGISPTQCLAFDIVDPVSNRRICSARYLPETGDIVCSVPNTAQNNIYATYPANVSEALLNNFGPIERSNAFVITDTTNWLTRKSVASLSHFQRTAPKGSAELLDQAFGLPRISDMVPNASMAAMMALQMGGGMMSGIGSGLSNVANQRHELNLQQNKFGHESNMLDKSHGYNLERDSQSHSFNLERDSQSHMFELERMLENFGYTNQLQAQQFQHNSDMSKQNFQQQQSMMFASSPNRALLGGTTRGQSFA